MTPTEVDERADVGPLVAVECLGITTLVGHSIDPEGYAPRYQEFEPKKAVQLPKAYADFLVKADPARFRIISQPIEAKKAEKAPAAPNNGPKMRAKK